MKTLKQGILIAGAVLAGSANLAAMSPRDSDGWLDGWYQTKMGRSSPITESAMRAEQANVAYREEAASAPENAWVENFWRAKFGRSSPLAQGNVAFREETGRAAIPANTWQEDFARMKHGRIPR